MDRDGCLLWGLGIGALVVAILLAFSIYIVPAGNVGIITHFGAVSRIAYPGLGFKWPIADGMVRMETRTLKFEVDAAAASSDLQAVSSKIAVNYHIQIDKVLDIFQNLGPNYAEKVISPITQSVWKSTTSFYPAPELIQKRNEVSSRAEKALAEKLAIYNIVVENISVVNFDFSPEYNASIEAKQVAAQQVETSRQKQEQAKVDAETALIAAQGQANAQKAVRESGSLTPEYLQYIAIQKWNGILPQVTGGAVPFIDLIQPTTVPTNK
jgi:regulator of protease activity HflC (stomatin/prohibitin superfamily)